MLSKKLLSLFASFLAIFACLLTIGLHQPWLQPGLTQAPPPAEAPINPNHIKLELGLLGFDPIKGELDVRMVLNPQGSFLDQKTGWLTSSVRLVDPQSVGKQEFSFEKKRPIESPVTKYVTSEGDPSFYPFDTYKTGLDLYLEKKSAAQAAPGAAPGATASEAEPELVPIEGKFYPALPGFDVNSKETSQSSDDYFDLEITIQRSLPVKFFSIIVMVIMWALAVIGLLIAISILRSGNMPETGALGFMGALLFAFPAIRNGQPNVPPVGVLSDFLSFFWAETIVVVALVITGVCWIKRYKPAPKA